MASFNFNEISANSSVYGPGFYLVGWEGNGDDNDNNNTEDNIELIGTSFVREMYHYDQNGDEIIAPYDNDSATYGLQMELYLPLSDIDDQFVDVDNVTQFYAKFTNSDINYYNNTFYEVVYVSSL